ncbi:MAG: PAS domain-containing protein [candidate division Zixibacteria bacterium]|nr:PAS domain-containing protein [candidate division Zixibacteria bacterium]
MDRRSSRRQLAIFVVILAVSVLSVALFALWVSGRLAREEQQQAAVANASLIAHIAAPMIESNQLRAIDSLCKSLIEAFPGRVTITDSTGSVLGDGLANPGELPPLTFMTDVSAAIQGKIGTMTGYDSLFGCDLASFSHPIYLNQKIVGVVRIGRVEKRGWSSPAVIVIFGGLLLVVTLGGFAGSLLLRKINRPTDDMLAGAERFAAGDFDYRVPAQKSPSHQFLAEALNTMAAQLDERIRAVSRQRNEQSAILSSMIEGVIAIDSQEKIISMNQAASRLVGADEDQSIGRPIRSVVRHSGFHGLIEKTLATGRHQEASITLDNGGERHIQASCTVLSDNSGQQSGGVIVMNDITKIRRLENLRRDFVANVSHELRTPITAIKGFVETLADGAIDDPASASDFVAIIQKHADRLNSIIEDLLSLSGIEDAAEKSQIVFNREALAGVIALAAESCRRAADQKNVSITLNCSPDVYANINSALLEQAVTNLIDNAVRYSQPGGSIVILVEMGNEIVIAVTDSGCGIEAHHLPRLFERFYRVDKSRNRAQGGTGLGLAIVKHIALAHGGSVSVESTPGAGSTFRIHVPAVS